MARRGDSPCHDESNHEECAPGPVGAGVREQRHRERGPRDRRRADVASELSDRDARSHGVELYLLKVEVVDRRPAVVDQKDRFALVATSNKPTGKERILGVARYDRVPGTDVAEVAVAVVDEFQHRGLGGALLAILARAAREHGIKTFTLIVLPENQQMLGLLRKMGWIHHARLSGGVYDISFDLPDTT